MAQFKSLNVLGNLSVTGKINSADSIRTYKLEIPTASGATTLGVGTNGQVLKSNGTTIYWGTDNDTITNVSVTRHVTTGVRLGTITINGTATDLYSGSLPLSGGNISGHIYLTGAQENSSTGNTSQIVFGTSSSNHVAISSNNNAIIINPTTSSTTNQIVLYLDTPSVFPSGITSNGTINATTLKENGTALSSKYLALTGGTVSGNVTATTFTENNLLLTRKYGTLLPFGTQIGTNVNLNTVAYIKVGNYFCSANTTVATLTNCPTTDAFMMQVYSPLATSFDNESTATWVYRLRKLLTYTGNEYVQQIYSGATAGTFTYGPWKKIAKTEDLSNYVPLSGNSTINGALSAVHFYPKDANMGCLGGTNNKFNSLYAYYLYGADNVEKAISDLALKSDISDTKVTQAYSTTNAYYPLLFSATSGTSSTSSRGATTTILCNKIYANPNTGSLTAGSISSGAITCDSLSSDGSITASGNIEADGGRIHTSRYVSVYDDEDEYTGTDNFDGDDIDTKYYAKGIIVGGSYKLAFPAKSGTLATLEDLAELGFKYSSFTLATSIAAECIGENKLKKFGKVVVASFSFVGGSGTNYPTFTQAAVKDLIAGLVIPEGFRPSSATLVRIFTDTSRLGSMRVNTNGTCQISTYPSDTGSFYVIGVTNTAWEVA